MMPRMLPIAVTCAMLIGGLYAQAPKYRPIAREALVEVLKSGALTQPELVDYIEALGVAFELTAEDIPRFAKLGATEAVQKAIATNYRGPKRATPTASGPTTVLPPAESSAPPPVSSAPPVAPAAQPSPSKPAAAQPHKPIATASIPEPVPTATIAAPPTLLENDTLRVPASLQSTRLREHPQLSLPPQYRLIMSRLEKQSGPVKLEVLIDKDGKVSTIKPLQGHPRLIAAAADGVRRWVYKPTVFQGKPVRVLTTVEVTFAVEE